MRTLSTVAFTHRIFTVPVSLLLGLSAVAAPVVAQATVAPINSAATTTASATPSQQTLDSLEKQVFGSADPATAFAKLSPVDQQWVKASVTPTGGNYTVYVKGVGQNAGKTFAATPSSLPNGCWSYAGTWTTTNAFGNWITKSYETTQVCYTAGLVTGVSIFNVWGQGTWGWYLANHEDETENAYYAGVTVSHQLWQASDAILGTSNQTVCPRMTATTLSASIKNDCSLTS